MSTDIPTTGIESPGGGHLQNEWLASPAGQAHVAKHAEREAAYAAEVERMERDAVESVPAPVIEEFAETTEDETETEAQSETPAEAEAETTPKKKK